MTGPAVQVFRRGCGAEAVQFEQMKITLLVQKGGMEVIRQELPAGTRWSLCPDPERDLLESVVVISGRLAWYRREGTVVLRAGDSLVAHPVREELVFQAKTRVHLLYFCSRPVFDLYTRQAEEMKAMAVAVEVKGGYTVNHCHHVAELSTRIGEAMRLSPDALVVLNHGAFLHDLGKMRVPDSILTKTGPLTAEEWEIMRSHTTWGREMVENTIVAATGAILEAHHERWDGSGYPHGRRGEDIPLEAQIVGVADSYCAMTTDRVYRARVPAREALAEIRRLRGVLYHPAVVDALVALDLGADPAS